MKRVVVMCGMWRAVVAASSQETEPEDSLTRRLAEIVVNARQPATRLEGSTLVSVIPGSDLQNLGTAIDVLAQLPMISVTDGAVSVTGKGIPEIYIDGRPMRDEKELLQLRSDNLKRVELIMSPGAMYASDTQAVLKITTRRNFVQGLSVTDRAEASRRRKWSGSNMLDLNYRRGEWDVFGSAVVDKSNRLIKGTTVNTFDYMGEPAVVGSSQHNMHTTNDVSLKAGFNYAAERGASFGAYYLYNPEKSRLTNDGTEWTDGESPLDRRISRTQHSGSHLLSLYYDNTFRGDCQLHFDGDYRRGKSNSNALTAYPDNDAADVRSADERASTFLAGKLYMIVPLLTGKMTLGTQDSYTHSSLDYTMLNQEVGEYIPSSVTDSRQTALAAFALWQKMLGRFSISAGLRYEYVDYLFKINGVKDHDVSRRHNLLTPDIGFGYNFNDRGQINLRYKMSTLRPPYSQLTGSLTYVGRHEIEGGNPSLCDERMHLVQLNGMWGDFMLETDFVRSIDTYGYVKRLYQAPTMQLIMQPVNINVSSLDAYLTWNRNIGRWTPDYTLGMHRQWLWIAETTYNRPIFSYYLANTVALPGNFMLTFNAHGESSGDMHTNRFGTTWFTMDASIGKTFLSKALQVKLSASDIFNSANNNWTMNTYGVYVDKRQSYDRRGLTLTVTYRFQPRQSKYKGGTASEAEMRRL